MYRRIKLANPKRLLTVVCALCLVLFGLFFFFRGGDPVAKFWESVAKERNAEIEPISIDITPDVPDQSEITAGTVINFSGYANYLIKNQTQNREKTPFEDFTIKVSLSGYTVSNNRSVKVPDVVTTDASLEIIISYLGKEIKYTYKVKAAVSNN